MPENLILVCFAVKEEARPSQQLVGSRPNIKTLLTGMGQRNAEKSIRAALAVEKPALVLSCGFAGGLNPELVHGTVVFSTRNNPELEARMRDVGAWPAQFYCADHVATTVSEKTKLWQTTGDDAVDMESQFIAFVCKQQDIPCVTLRVILDTANESLPLDFNALMNADQQLDFKKLAWAIVKSPGKIGALMRLQKQSNAAAEKLAQVLAKVIAA
jgi:nucleoside phosphorylase